MINSRDKGKAGELEVRDLFRTALKGRMPDVTIIRRNHQQAEIGGADLVGVPYFSVEVKRVKQIVWGASGLYDWWAQCIAQTEDGKHPCLVFRQDFSKWLVMIQAIPVPFYVESDVHETPMIMPWEGFAWYLNTVKMHYTDL